VVSKRDILKGHLIKVPEIWGQGNWGQSIKHHPSARASGHSPAASQRTTALH